jgi:hypothetical protein
VGSAGFAGASWATAATPIPDASTQTRDNKRFMELKNSFGVLGGLIRILVL